MPVPFATLLTAAALTVGLGPPLPLALAGQRPSGVWAWPLAGTPVVARPFQPPATRWGPGHRGVDLAAAPGAAVLAAGPGVVSFAGYVAGVGVVSILHAGGLRTTYEPVAPTVVAGRSVAVGDPIATLLSGHGDCGPGRWCLHWGLLRRSVYLNPLTLVRRGPVRLLPLGNGGGALARLPLNAGSAATSAALPLPEAAVAPAGLAVTPVPARQADYAHLTDAGSGAGTLAVAPSTPGRLRAAALGPSRLAGLASVATGAAGAAAALTWSIRWARKRGMAAHRGRHRGVVRVQPAGLSRAGRRAWP
jgi:hypothetical protein